MSSRLTFGFICVAIGIMHLTFLVLFFLFGVWVLGFVNCGSVALYTAGAVYFIKKDVTTHSTMWITSIYAEIILHSALCTFMLGMDTYFIVYPLISLPVCVSYLFFYCERKYFVKNTVVFVCVMFVFTAGTVVVAEVLWRNYPMIYLELDATEIIVFRSLNILFSTISLFAFTLTFFLEMSRLIDKLRSSADELNYTATHDNLTGLVNRGCFWNYCRNKCKKDSSYSIAIGDLDNFKNVNDTYGHGCGDLVLKRVSGILLDSVTEDEIACRWGGEEMVVVFMDNRDTALARLEKIRSRIEAMALQYEGKNVPVTMTFGFVDSGELAQAVSQSVIRVKERPIEESISSKDIESLISMADARLYVGKSGGKNIVVYK